MRCAATEFAASGHRACARSRARAEFPPHARSPAAMSPLRLAVDARVVAEDTRGIGRYARAVLRRLVARDDVELTLLEHGPFAFRHRGGAGRARSDRRAFSCGRRRADRSALDVVWHPANGTLLPLAPSERRDDSRRGSISLSRRRRQAARARAGAVSSNRRARAKRFVAVSEFGRDELHDVFAIAARTDRGDLSRRRAVVCAGPGAAACRLRCSSRRYLLFVGDPDRRAAQEFHDALRRLPARVAGSRRGASARAGRRRLAGARVGGRRARRKSRRRLAARRRRRRFARALSRRARARARVVSRNVRHADARGDGVRHAGRGIARKFAARDRRRCRHLYAPPDDADAWARRTPARHRRCRFARPPAHRADSIARRISAGTRARRGISRCFATSQRAPA